MPFRKRRTRKRMPIRRHRRRRNVFNKKRRTVKVVRGPSIMPDSIMVKLKYSASFNRVMILPLDNYVFRGNSVFDPDETGVGQQPAGYDQMAAFYGRYRVHGSKITCRFMGATTGNGSFARAVVLPTIDNAPPVNLASAVSNPYAKESYYSGAGGSNKAIIKNFMSTKKIYGIKSLGQENSYSAIISQNPTREFHWQITTTTLDGSTGANYYLIVTVVYYVQFFGRLEQNLS